MDKAPGPDRERAPEPAEGPAVGVWAVVVHEPGLGPVMVTVLARDAHGCGVRLDSVTPEELDAIVHREARRRDAPAQASHRRLRTRRVERTARRRS